MSGGPPVIAVLGLGEAGSAIAADLAAAGAVVRGFDPRVRPGPGVTACTGDADACRGAAVVVSLTCAHEAEEALVAALPGISPGAIYADLNTASAQAKVRLAALAEGGVAGFTDVALMSPVPGNGLRTPMLASGPAAAEFARIFGGLGARVDVLPGPPGTAAARKLVRSVFYKGLAANWRAPRPARSTGWSRAACGMRCGASTRWPRRGSSCAGSACRRGWPAPVSSGCGNWRRSRQAGRSDRDRGATLPAEPRRPPAR
jgi:3-hydroxyisobutyrate dehydrogenase-like beta-hydroxyacid dehydrogenase